jgi:hypothetical protein
MSANESGGGATADPPRGRVRAVVERYRDEPNQCTIFPEVIEEDERLTVWITAEEPWYVDLRQYR